MFPCSGKLPRKPNALTGKPAQRLIAGTLGTEQTSDLAARRSEIVALEIERNPSGAVALRLNYIDFTKVAEEVGDHFFGLPIP